MRKFSLSALAVVGGTTAMLLSGCGSSSTATGPTDLAASQVLHMTWAASQGVQISPIDPGTASDTTVGPIINLTFDGLVQLDQNLKVEDWGADKITTSADGLTYTFHLRSGQSFSDGTAVKASDYAYGMTRSLDPCFQSPVNYYLYAVKGAAAYSDQGNCVNNAPKTPLTSIVADDGAATVTMTLEKPAAFFLSAMTYSTSFAIERSVISGANLGADDTWTKNIVADATHPTGQGGSGMYYVSQYDSQGNLVLKQNPHWWGLTQGKKPYLTEIDYKIFADGDSEYAAYNTGSAYDETDSIPTAQYPTAKASPDFHEYTPLIMQFAEFNWKIAPFDNVDARQAFCEAINRTAIANNVLKTGQTPGYHIVPKGMPGYDANVTGPDGITDPAGDLTKAQAHWAAYKATLNGAPLPTIKYTYDIGSQSAKNYATALVAGWNQAFPDAKVTLNPLTFQERIKEEDAKNVLQSFRFGWAADYPDAQDWLTLLFDTNSSYNKWNASVPQADQLMEQADGTADQNQRTTLYNQAEQLLVNNVATCPVYQYAAHYRVRQFVHGYVETAQGNPSNDQWVQTYIATH
jgi:peptide/nickel transport system substrate-binding protein/oligopeptide transport system substrate-binding protein